MAEDYSHCSPEHPWDNPCACAAASYPPEFPNLTALQWSSDGFLPLIWEKFSFQVCKVDKVSFRGSLCAKLIPRHPRGTAPIIVQMAPG